MSSLINGNGDMQRFSSIILVLSAGFLCITPAILVAEDVFVIDLFGNENSDSPESVKKCFIYRGDDEDALYAEEPCEVAERDREQSQKCFIVTREGNNWFRRVIPCS
ncbi:MAG: hypothetical protein NWQ23_08755 [Yoonia sp.]|uniref:hypothetical protein n=1 Tax=Yoonia sp. TaxID=2212373 RepID=UPI0027401A29|nr:hypothetical protein [Yoonia sp.]MDP5085496.1 hypothetical protein [Yoonia sp.]